ncbi:hypothetical protein P3X46_031273 [Hevea brasiliensis]|uniref:Uncharacterized protein n=1 Tax=Hevea brasiliensis TaxID=3981 RepID=A0ABQ9KJU7_HEVBR|nr:hypothetical protein P3X46_031273 [Hevea brasiliensis]
MSRGDGPQSYFQNSYYQRSINCKTFCIADWGCSVGPNMFIAMESIVQALELKFHTQHPIQSHPSLDFQVFFNDQTENDFNTLFRNLPISRDFHDCLLSKSSLHIWHASYALNWLSKIPEEVMDPKSPAWNKDAIDCTKFAKENDMDTFLNAGARELAAGGLLTIILVGLPADGILFFQTATGLAYDLLSSCLVDLAKKKLSHLLYVLISKEKVEAFNLPLNYPSIKDMEELLGRSESFSIERLETISNHAKQKPTVQFAVSTIRAFMVEQIKEHFGGKIVY